ncbi:AraC family transcriptional regulator [Gordonia amicalis]|nr:AraC family transcriptional regulator [Gordonia amicalis]UOG20524.1 AraC family transcriptional regulator [Gordonia amicalis]
MSSAHPARHLLRAKDLADVRFAEPLTVDDMAAAAKLSRAHFSRAFTAAFGQSPHSYLQTRRRWQMQEPTRPHRSSSPSTAPSVRWPRSGGRWVPPGARSGTCGCCPQWGWCRGPMRR